MSCPSGKIHKSLMTGQERVLAVLKLAEPDRIPTFEWEIDPNLIKQMSHNGTYEDFIENFNLDAVVTRPNYDRKPLGGACFIDEWGVTRQKNQEAYLMPIDTFSPIKSWSDLERWNPPNPYTPNRFETLERLVKRFKGRRAVFVQIRDVFTNPRDLLGFSQLLIDCKERPDFVMNLVEKCVNQSIALVERAADIGAEIVMSADDIAGNQGTMFSPAVWRSIFFPHFKRFVEAVHACGLLHWKHSCGNIMPILDSFIEAGIDGIDPIDPVAKMDLTLVKRQYGKRLAIKGNVACDLLIMEQYDENTVIEAVKACIRAAGPEGGYVCSSSNSLPFGVKPHLYSTMLKAIQEYGAYPLDLDKLNSAGKK